MRALYFPVSSLSFSAIKYQDATIPAIIPITDQLTLNPIVITAPGKASNNHADSPEARSEKAVTQGPNLRPARR